jgi:hypothetical protein
MPKEIKKHKVEIYFILYLAALILILPDNKKIEKNSSGYTKAQFSLIPEKTVLNLRLLKKDGVNNIIKFDSVNKIYINGNFDNIDVRYTVNDVNRGETVVINELNNSKETFQIDEDLQNKVINFKWKPDLNFDYNSTYLVKLEAIVEKDGESETIRTQFTLNSLFLNQVFGGDMASNQIDTSGFNLNYFNTPLAIPTNLSNMDVKISKNPILTYADNEWINYVRVYNISSIDDLYGPPKVSTYGDSLLGGSAHFESSDGNNFVFSGVSPTYDTMKVNVKLKRKVDNSELSFDFLVIPLPRTAPNIPEVMYIGETYTINSKLGENANSYTIIRAGQYETKFTNGQFTFTPESSMLDANVILTRYVDNKKLDNYVLVIKQKPRPSVENIEIKNNRIVIKTKTFSLQRNKNYVIKVKNNLNLNFNDIIGKSYFDSNYQFQTFESEVINKNVNSIEIQLVEKSGQPSIKKTFYLK